ncbi:toxin-activating lysine-acyltransferase [Mesorhizobium sp. CN2-181]|uniref:toxin-activating lysine-acyltransferase n=1 Tax=Mesorhizobium TaxID=68287 RepID=UPI0032B7CCDC
MDASQQPTLSLYRPEWRALALGLAVSHLMTKPSFMRIRFGELSQLLAGVINRDHYFFVVDETHRVQGFAGWALTSRNNAEDWLNSRRGLRSSDCLAGECIVMNAWSANSTSAHRYMLKEARRLLQDKDALFFKRYYEDGSTRPVRINMLGLSL